MPELPEVETVRRGLAPVMEGAVFRRVELRRPDLRFPLPAGFANRLIGASIEALDRRGKYLTARLSTGEILVMHLGMSGRFTVTADSIKKPGRFHAAQNCAQKHDHVIFHMAGAHPAVITYNDPRRFGFMDLAAVADLEKCKHFKGMGPEPLSNQFSAASLNAALKGKSTPIKAALLDQRIVAGLGNIYVCEALYRSRISPRRKAGSVAGKRGERLCVEIVSVLRDAIEAGGSSLRDFASAEGELGYFQHRFDVYDREGEACRQCANPISRVVQAGRSTFFCSRCQR
ncbi:bifunctional DNA-formamidopyrimidine glycosylase/DNA-(apurinic or apyrimidinic site) lyase [Hyphococcus flavus]|uniref:Formamidopyrimidine-DNA glycosylase n=1 Tax=Hyphococcus flavus TaxID=1866326 RepID=A0AAE9ZCN8_9PROT|nr:bifunctional DNA-formamidopyrimidine glycosylase/DNA-(apurinic or apyrimidinic site) lyase [Hyphococcus flavus]WDI30002.1 bifunctional DNA-formamidopyrimidine glycosylase/DNA-(apurinic or apyrimidinic site) lyase [Hyphococcus flavus]